MDKARLNFHNQVDGRKVSLDPDAVAEMADYHGSVMITTFYGNEYIYPGSMEDAQKDMMYCKMNKYRQKFIMHIN